MRSWFQYSYLSVRQTVSFNIKNIWSQPHVYPSCGLVDHFLKKKKKLSPWGKNTVNTGKLGMSTMKQGEPYKSIQGKFHHVTNETHSLPGVSNWLSKILYSASINSYQMHDIWIIVSILKIKAVQAIKINYRNLEVIKMIYMKQNTYICVIY